MILTGGITIGEHEQQYVQDALVNGWDQSASKYTKLFQELFIHYTGTEHARTFSGGTQALFMALAALGIKEGDEVILPELTYFACSDVVANLGATPVFVDVLPDTWCIDPEAFRHAITSKTKAVMPVWLYGNAPEMDQIMEIANTFNIHVVEDACPAVGSFFKGKHAGTFGTFGAFSFHPAKIITTGMGGMLVTNNAELFNRVQFLADHGEDKTRRVRFWQTEVGYTFDMANINAAFGLAQLERIDELREKKNKIYNWYHKRLAKYEYLSLNPDDLQTNKVMTTVILGKDFGVTRQGVIDRLVAKGIDSRPVFYPISMFPMYKEQDTPVAHWAGLNGINLPSGVQRTEEEIDMICNSLIEILCL